MNPSLVRILKTLAASFLLTVAVYLNTQSWPQSISIGLVGFLVFGYIVNTIRDTLKTKVIMQTYLTEMEALAARMLATVNCAFCSRPNAVKFQMDVRNEFPCQHCGKPNLLIITAETAQVTTPLHDATEPKLK